MTCNTLILGGARSGKSRYGETLAHQSGLEVVYIATGWAGDAEMAERIARHQASRPAHWLTVEEPRALATCLQQYSHPNRFLLVDCLTLWLSNLLEAGDGVFQRERHALLQCLPQLTSQVCLISNEVGQGIVPMNPLARRFVDESGWLHQDLARICQRVVWMVAGLPQLLKEDL